MQQLDFASLIYLHKKKKTRKELFLADMEKVFPWATIEDCSNPFMRVKHVFRAIQIQFGDKKVRYREIENNDAHLKKSKKFEYSPFFIGLNQSFLTISSYYE